MKMKNPSVSDVLQTKESGNQSGNPTWGEHSHEVCFLDYSVGSKTLHEGSSSFIGKSISSYCVAMVSEDELQFVQMMRPDQVDILRAFNRGKKHLIKFRKILDVCISKRNEVEVKTLRTSTSFNRVPTARIIDIYLDCGAVCKIKTNGNGLANLGEKVLSAWQSSVIRRSSHLPKLNSRANKLIADEYLTETINSLKLNDICISVSDKLSQKSGIFDEFASEIWSDLQLKNSATQSRELFVSTVTFCKQLVKEPLRRSSASLQRGGGIYSARIDETNSLSCNLSTATLNMRSSSTLSLLSTSRNLFSEKTREGETSSEIQLRLQATALQRLIIIRSALKAMVAALFSSEACTCRYGLVGGPAPMTLDVWCSLLTPDLYLQVCETLGCSPESEEQQVTLAMCQSMLLKPSSVSLSTHNEHARNATPSSLARNKMHDCEVYRASDVRSPAVSALWRQSEVDLVTSSILTPYKDRSRIKSSEITAAAPSLADNRRAVRDLQAILMLELFKIAAIGYTSITRHIDLNCKKNVPTLPTATSPLLFGATFTQQIGWQKTLEDLLVRVSVLLDDLLCSASVTSTMLHLSLGLGVSLDKQQLKGEYMGRLDEVKVKGKEKEKAGSVGKFSSPSPSVNGSRGINRSSSSSWLSSSPALKSDGRDIGGESNHLTLRVPATGSVDWSTQRIPTVSMSVTGSSSSFDTGLNVPLIGTSRATVPPSPSISRTISPVRYATGRASDVLPWGIDSAERERGRERDSENEREIERERVAGQCRCPLETQEILLFYHLSLLHSLALDSSKIRKELGQDLSSYWLPIMHIFNTICPRPHPSSSRTHCTHVKHSASSSSASSVSGVTIPPSLNTETSYRSEEIKEKGKGEGEGRSFLDYFRNKSKRSQSKEENCAINKQADFTESSSTSSSSSSSSSLLEDSSAHSSHVDDSAPLLVGDYGPAQYGISDASWYLLIMARRCTEELVLMLGLCGRDEDHDEEDTHTNNSSNSNRGQISFRLRQPTHMTDRATLHADDDVPHSDPRRSAIRSSSRRDKERNGDRDRGTQSHVHTHTQRMTDKRPSDYTRWESSDDGDDDGEGEGAPSSSNSHTPSHSNSRSSSPPPRSNRGVSGASPGPSTRRRTVFKSHNGSDSQEDCFKPRTEIGERAGKERETERGSGRERGVVNRDRGLPPRNPIRPT